MPGNEKMEAVSGSEWTSLGSVWKYLCFMASLAAVGGVVLAGLAGVYTGVGGVLAAAIYALCLIAMLACSTIYNASNPCAARTRSTSSP